MKYPIVVKGKTIKQVTKLNLSGKNLKEIPENVYDYTNLEKLDLSHNQIASIPQAILKLRKLRTIDLSFNKISVLQSSIFKLPKLRVLNLHGNEIQNLPKQVKDSHLKILILSKNKFEEKPEELLHSIANVDIEDNPMKKKRDKSEHQMEEVQNSMKETLSKENGYKKLNIFISYSHEDKDYLNRLQIHLKVLKYLYGNIDAWSDERIRLGDHWKDEIKQAMDNASVAILLVSTDFLASDFVENNELPEILKKEKQRNLKIFCLLVKPCLFTDSCLSEFQAANPPEKTLVEMNEAQQDRVYLKLMDEIKSIL